MTLKRKKVNISNFGEFALIERLTGNLEAHRLVPLGVGDDAALISIPKGSQLAASCDLLVENVHFKRQTTKPAELGHKALAVNLSDIAAMGAKPIAALVSISLPTKLRISWVTAFYRGMKTLAERTGTALAGGDTSKSPGSIVINVTILGHVEKGKALRRDRAKVGDGLWVCGHLGHSRAGFEAIENKLRAANVLKSAHLLPEPLIAEGRALIGSGRCNSCIDVSDGLLQDLSHICERSGVGAEIEFARLPITKELRAFAKKLSADPVDYALYGGEDYALLFTLDGKCKALSKWPADCHSPVKIGRITEGNKIVLVSEEGFRKIPKVRGFDHFS